jgi:hypothetical protein
MATRPKRPRDPNQLAKLIVDLSTGEAQDPEESKKAAAGRIGGLKGGVVRATNLSKQKRIEIAKRAAQTRWKNKPKAEA